MTRRQIVLLGALYGLFLVLLALLSPAGFTSFFAWPAGGVWSNLIASFLLGVPALTTLFRRLARQHAEHLRALHERHDQLLATLKEHWDGTPQPPPRRPRPM